MQYLDPRNPHQHKKLSVPTVSDLRGKTLGYLNNGWISMGKIGRRIEGELKAKYGVSRVIFYDVPRSTEPPPGLLDKVVRECQVAIVGMAN